MKDIGPRIKVLRKKAKWSTTKLATLAGISQSFLSRLESGATSGSWETYQKLAGALAVPIDALFPYSANVEHASIGFRRIPVLDYIQAGQWTGVNGNSTDEDMKETVLTDLEHPPSTFALRIKGDSMEPRFATGDIVVIDPTLQPRPGDYVVAVDESGEATFKQFRNAGLNDRGTEIFELLPLNTLYAPMRSDRQQIAIVGVMVEHRQYRKR